ncbi:MAG: beta-ketoacyl synthase N-terminal-like domain-containing protein [Phycisphaerae bacterium]
MTRAQADSGSVVITGCGWVTPFAAGTIRDVLEQAANLQRPEVLDGGYWAVPEAIRQNYPGIPAELGRDREGWIAAAALEAARKSAALGDDDVNPERVGMVLGSAAAGQVGMMNFATEVRQQSARFVSPIHFPQTVGNYVDGALARGYHIRGPHATLACGAASSLEAMVEAAGVIRTKRADVVYAGGVSALTAELAQGVSGSGARHSEGACVFVMESSVHAASRGADVLAQVTEPRGPRVDPAGVDIIVVETTGCRVGQVATEYWTGRCAGALGAACAATAIGAVSGLPVPLWDDSAEGGVSITTLTPNNIQKADGTLSVRVCADDDRGHRATLELTVALRG